MVKISKQVKAHLGALSKAWKSKNSLTGDLRAWAGVIGMDKKKVVRVMEEITRPKDNRSGCSAMVRLLPGEISKALLKVVKRGFTPCGFYRISYYSQSTGEGIPVKIHNGILLNKSEGSGILACQYKRGTVFIFSRVRVVE